MKEPVGKTVNFSDNREPDAWLEVHEGSEEVLDATLVKPDVGEPGVRYLPLYCAPSHVLRSEPSAESVKVARDYLLKEAQGYPMDSAKILAPVMARELVRLASFAASATGDTK